MKKLIYSVLFVALITSNILSITSARFHDLLADLLSYIPVPELMTKSKRAQTKRLIQANTRLENKQKKLRANFVKAKRISHKSKARIAKNLAKNVGALVTSSVPMVGIATNVAIIYDDVTTGCETMKAFDELEALFSLDDSNDDTKEVCEINIPPVSEVERNVEAEVNRNLTEVKEAIGGTLHQIRINWFD